MSKSAANLAAKSHNLPVFTLVTTDNDGKQNGGAFNHFALKQTGCDFVKLRCSAHDSVNTQVS